ncbi:MAG: hypothetical protein CMP61_01485 [Flavobacteriales bacterium]|nr:hypothetical protein [Flavobacteriales bacterium]
MRLISFNLFFILLLFGCDVSQNPIQNKDLLFSYKSLIQDLTLQKVKLIKYITYQNKVDTIIISEEQLNLKKELQLFEEAIIIKRPQSSYEMKNIKEGCSKKYDAIDQNQIIRRLEFNTCNNDFSIQINMNKSSPLFAFNYTLNLDKSGYVIQVDSKVDLVYQSIYTIEGTFLKQ